MIINFDKRGGGGSGSGATYTAGQYINISSSNVISVSGITPEDYITSADTEDFLTTSALTEAISGVNAHIIELEEVTSIALNELHTDIDNCITSADTANFVSSLDISDIVKITQDAYDALSAKSSTTLYIITD